MGKAEKNEKTTKKQKHFWKDFKAELKKVIWPTRSQVVNNTIIVVVIVVIVTAIVFLLDLAFEALNTYGIDKVRTLVQNQVVNEVGTDNNGDNTNTAENTNQEDHEGHDHENEENTGNDNTPHDTANVENVSE